MQENSSDPIFESDASTRDLVKNVAWKMLSEGQKPSVNSVRAIIGRGSATTIQSALNGWWKEVGKRLSGIQSQPDIPDAVMNASREVWAAAIKDAQRIFEVDHNAFIEQSRLLEGQVASLVKDKKDLIKQVESNERRIESQKDLIEDLQSQLARMEQSFRDKAIEHEQKLRQQAEDHTERLELVQLRADAQDKRRKAEVDAARKEAREAFKLVKQLEIDLALAKQAGLAPE